MAVSPQPLRIWRTVVPPAWIDYNGHLNEGYYGVAFGDASDALLDHLGFDGEYRENHGTFYTVETRIRFLREVHEGSEIHTATLLLGADEKRLHVHHDLLVGDSPDPVATQETMMLHVAQHPTGPGVAPMSEPLLGRALALATLHSTVSPGDHVGRGVRTLR
jgi:acyl-CoA thioesterase FadM